MGALGVHFAIEKDLAARLIKVDGDDEALVEIVQEEIEDQWDEEHLFESGKAWDALHRCLSNGTLNGSEGQPPLNLCFLGGRALNAEPEYFVLLLAPPQVEAVAEALAKVTEKWLRDRYYSVGFPDYQGEKTEDDFLYSWETFQGLPAFFQQATAEGRWVIFTVDQ